MKNLIFFVLFISSISGYCQSEIFDPFVVNKQIKNAIEEDKEEKEIYETTKKEFAITTLAKETSTKLLTTYKNLEKRVSKLSPALDAVKILLEIKTTIEQLLDDIKKMSKIYLDNKEFTVLTIEQVEVLYKNVEDANQYLIALILGANEVLTMDNGDRQIIVNYIINDLREIQKSSKNLLNRLIMLDIKKQNPVKFTYVNRDVEIIKEIIQNAKDY